MVYCGKPSKSCHACRQRKSRCDAKPSGCTQCFKAGRKCPGYRKEIDLIFRDQSKDIVRKVRNAEPQDDSTSPPSTPETAVVKVSPPEKNFQDLSWPPPWAVNAQLTANVDQSATNYFLRNFVQNAQSPVMGFYGFIESLYAKDQVDEALSASLKAVSLASFNRVAQSADLPVRSQQQYSKALQLVNTALRNEETAKRDSTLIAVLVLGIYEMVCGTNRSADAWTRHIRGTAALVELRGLERLKTKQEQMVFGKVIQFLRMSSLVHKLYTIPPFIVEAVKSLQNAPDGIGAAMKNHSVMIEVNQILARDNQGDPVKIEQTVTELLDRDKYLLATYCKDIRGLHYEVFDSTLSTDSNVLHGGRFDVYKILPVANLWNAVRALRIYLHLGVIRCIGELQAQHNARGTPPPDWQAQEQASTAIAIQMQKEILASVPQQLGQIAKNKTTGEYEVTAKGDKVDVAGYFEIIYPLWLAGSVQYASSQTRNYCAERLEYIGREIGVQQATVLAQMVRNPMPSTSNTPMPTTAPH